MIILRIIIPLIAYLGFVKPQKCYRKDGLAMPDHPCDPGAEVSACCGQGWTCSSNMYCTDPEGFQGVGSCTDITWQSPACPFVELSMQCLFLLEVCSSVVNFMWFSLTLINFKIQVHMLLIMPRILPTAATD